MARYWMRMMPLLVVGLLAAARPALAGPPLLCHPFDIGGAASLPWDGSKAWWDGRADYDLANLVRDTEALLTPSTPVIVRMETLRRAALYASHDRRTAAQLLTALTGRLDRRGRGGAPDALALFDAGYLAETFRQIALIGEDRQFTRQALAVRGLAERTDGYALVTRSLALRPADPAIEFAAALVSQRANQGKYHQHAAKARQGASQDALLARNIKQLT